MVRAKETESLVDFMQRDFERREREYGPVLKERYYVIEHRAAYNTGGYYDQDVPAENRKVSPYFDTEDEAQAWMDKHEADKGKSLHIWKDQLYERKVREWRYDYDYNRTRKNRASVVE